MKTRQPQRPNAGRPRFVPTDFRPVTLWVPQATLDRVSAERGPAGFVGLVAELLAGHLAEGGVS
jgi:hypothetical protein